MQRAVRPVGQPVRIRPFSSSRLIPSGSCQSAFRSSERRHAVGVQPAALEQDSKHVVVARLRNVIRGFFVVRIGTALEEQARHTGVLRHARGSVDRALDDLSRRRVDRLVPAGVRIRPSVEDYSRRPDEWVRPRAVETQVAGEAQVSQRIPAKWTALGRSERGVAREEVAHGRLVGDHRCRVDAAPRDLRMTRADRLGPFERARRMPCARRSGRLEEGCQRIGQRFDFMCDGERLDVRRERWPAVEAMLARDDELRVGERQRCHSPGIGCVRSAHVLFDAARGVSVARSVGVAQLRCLFLVLLDVRTGRQMRQAYESSFTSPGVRSVRLVVMINLGVGTVPALS